MTRGHLNSEDICRWMAGERDAEEQRHVRECSQCGAQVARLDGALKRFGGLVREWSAAQPGAQAPGGWRADRRWRVRPLRWSLAAGVIVVLAAIPVWKNARDRGVAEEAARADATLMEQVDVQVSRTVPVTLEPLVSLVEWEKLPAAAGAAQDAPGKKEGEER